MKPVITVSGLSKSYDISHRTDVKASYGTLKDDFASLLKKPLGFGNQSKEEHEIFWALKDISFKVNQGEIFGVIGENGSGKSTLLKILSRIVEPTTGDVHLRGRTASLLEVGTGFHPELTGRENIFFNGSMLGMSRLEIRKKFDDIVAFSEIEKFLDTPVKFYSSGMYVRLAFSVAAYLDSEILILDEVLAVGDAGFQKKSLNKILATMQEGRTVLFVSHSMGAVQQLCARSLLLKRGKIDYIGDTGEVVERYMQIVQKGSDATEPLAIWEGGSKIKNDYFIPEKIYITDSLGEKIIKPTPNNKDYYFTVEATVKETSDLLTIGYGLYNSTKTLMYMSYSSDKKQVSGSKLPKGKVTMRGKIPKHFLNEGIYKISLVGGIHNKFWLFEPGMQTPSVELIISGALSESPYWTQAREGLLAPIIDWDVTIR